MRSRSSCTRRGRAWGALRLVAGGVLVLLGSAGPAAAQASPRAGGELIFVVPAEPPSYDAHREETFALVHPAAPHYNTLLRVDPADRTGNYSRYVERTLDALYEKQSRTADREERRRAIRDFEKRLLDEEAHYIYTFQWHRIVPHSARVRSWTITPSHFLNQQLDGVWLSEN